MTINYNAIKTSLFAIVIPFIISCSCNSKDHASSNEKNNELNQILVCGSKVRMPDAIAKMIGMSDIKKGGYVVIIPTPDLKKDDNSKVIKRLFNEQQIMAVHILNLCPVSKIKKSEIIAIKNATIVCFVGDKSYRLRRLANKEKLRDALFDAITNGSLISSIGGAASVLSDYYLWVDTDYTSNSKKITRESGLGLLQNIFIDHVNFFENNKTAIETEFPNANINFVEISDDNILYLNTNDKIAIKERDNGTYTDFNNRNKIEKSNQFNVLECKNYLQ